MIELVKLQMEGCEYSVAVDYTFTKGVPGKLCGPPEDCYPEEPEDWELHTLMLGDLDLSSLLEIHYIEREIINQLKESSYD